MGTLEQWACATLAAFTLAACGGPSTIDDVSTGDGATDTVGDIPSVDVRDVPSDVGDGGSGDAGGATCGEMIPVCNPVTNRGCATGQACSLTGAAGMQTGRCIAAGVGGWEAPCGAAMPCREGFACLSNDMGMTFRCVKLCCGPADTDRCRDIATGGRVNATCSVNINGVDFMGCSADSCDWHLQDCPRRGTVAQTCLAIDVRGATACAVAGMAMAGDPCVRSTDCVQGHLCITAGTGTPTCRRVCDPTATSPADGGGAFRTCPMGFVCRGIRDRPPDFGDCQPM